MSLKLATNALHAGHDVTKTQGTRAVPIYQTSSYVFNDSDHAANLFALAESGYIYTRLNNPTNDVLEQRLASVEGGVAAVVTASGTAAIATTLLTLLKTGDHIVASSSLYGGTFNMLNNTLPRFGITTTFVDPDDVENFAKAVQPNTRAFFAESLGNPKLDVLDLKGISAHAKAAKVPFIVDNTIATPCGLHKECSYIILDIKLNVRTNGMEVGKGTQRIGKLYIVVPYKYVLAQFSPIL
jgi:O-acetylhomoserine (thiol)-lyase